MYKKTFYDNLNTIVKNLISAYGLRYLEEVDNLSEPIMRWLDFRLRYIDTKPRTIAVSNKFPLKLPSTVEIALHHLEKLIISGENINPYQSRTLINYNDSSGKKRTKRTDLLWADWGISHLHLTDVPLKKEEFFSSRDCSDKQSYLLFCLVLNDTIGFIDIKPHSELELFSNIDLMQTVADSWPGFMNQHELKGILGTTNSHTNDEVKVLRNAGITAMLNINNKTYIGPGLGVTMASTSTKVSDRVIDIQHWIRQLSDFASDENGQIRQHCESLGIFEPKLELRITPQGLAILESTSNIAFDLSTLYAKLTNLIFPEWALARILKNSS